MTPINGKFTFKETLNITSSSAGNVTLRTGDFTEIIVTAATSINAIKTAPFLFLPGGAVFNYGCRIIDTKSPVSYNVTSMSWTSNQLTLTHAAIPVAAIATVSTQQFHITNSSDTNKVPNGIYTTVSSASHTTTSTIITLNTDPGSLTGVTAKVQPGIIPTNNDNRGYYTINMPYLSAQTTAAATAMWTPITHSNTGQTFVSVVSATPANLYGYIWLDGKGRIAIPQGIPFSLNELQSGKYFVSSAASNDVAIMTILGTPVSQNY